jgi:hypothetical protein
MTTLQAILLMLAWTPLLFVLACILRDIQASPTIGNNGAPRRGANYHVDSRTRDDGPPPFSRGF